MGFPEYEGNKVHSINTVAQWKESLQKHSIVLADFYGKVCPPCRLASPIFGKLSTEHENVHFVKVNNSEGGAVFSENGVTAMPTFMLFKNGELKQKIVGWRKSELMDCIKSVSKPPNKKND